MRFWITVALFISVTILVFLSVWDIARADLSYTVQTQEITLPTDTPEKDALDLIAQQRMADWAFWMMVLTAVSAASTITSICVAGTLAGRQIQESREANIIQSRAYLHGNGVRYISHRDSNGRIFWRIWVDWINVGNTPAKNVTIIMRFGPKSTVDGPGGLFGRRAQKGIVIRSQGSIEIGPYELQPDDIYSSLENGDPFTLLGHATYNDVFEGTEIHETIIHSTLVGYSGDIESYFDKVENPVRMSFTEDYEFNSST